VKKVGQSEHVGFSYRTTDWFAVSVLLTKEGSTFKTSSGFLRA